jgi:trimeric autotransporter adhesin
MGFRLSTVPTSESLSSIFREESMKTRAKRYQIALLLTLLALAAFTIHAQRAVTTARSQNPNLTWGQALAAAFTSGKPASATINHKRKIPDASRADALVHPQESNDTAEAMTPAQSGGNFNITESVIAGGGERSAGGAYDQTSTIGQSALGEAGGGAFSVSGGFWQGSACSAPAITGQPQSQTVCVGSSVSFCVGATGTGLTYQWRKGGVAIPGANASCFNIPSVTPDDAGNYELVITGACGTVTSIETTLAVNAGAVINQHPLSPTVCVTQPVSFSVAATGVGLTYQWRKNTINIPGATNPSFNIPSTVLGDAGNYDVVITAACGSLTSAAAMLTVNPATAINTQPSSPTVCAGAPASFSVGATGAGLSYQWRKGGVNIPGATASSYSIASAAAGDAGNYDVIVAGTCGTATSTAATLTVNPVTAITMQPANQPACEDGPATFSVTATGVGLTYQWRRNNINIGGATASSYVIAAASAGDAGNYDVVVTGACGSVTSSAASLTLNAATAINTQPTDQTVCVAAPANFSVAASGTSLTYQWRKGGVNIAGATGSSYNIPATVAGDAGNYDVVVTGACGTVTSNSTSLTVNPLTAITTS